MKIIHTADWHLGDNFHGFDRTAEHQHFLGWLQDLIKEERPDALLVSGDVFDCANPSAQAEEQFYAFLNSVTHLYEGLQVVITAGNHDSGRRLQAPAPLLHTLGVTVRGCLEHDEKGRPVVDDLIVPLRSISNPDESVAVLAVPYIRPTDLGPGKNRTDSLKEFFADLAGRARKQCGKHTPLVLMAHLYAAGAEVALNDHSERLVVGGEDCTDVDVLDRGVSYVALGHIHKAQQVGGDDRMVFYAGSPIPMSFAEKHYHHGVNKVVIGPTGGLVVDQVEYTPLRKIVSLPDSGAASLADVLQQIKQLPDRSKHDSDTWTYLEITLQSDENCTTAQTEILNALDNKAARLCKLVKEAPPAAKTGKPKANTLEQLMQRTPLDIALDAYLQATGEEMTDDIIERFNAAALEAQHSGEESANPNTTL